MEYKYRAIRQKYKGHRYDSKHEVRWAKFLMGSALAVQPHPKWARSKLWFPDFGLKAPSGRIILAEIKPTWDFVTPALKSKMKNHRALTRQNVELVILVDTEDEILGTFVGRNKIIRDLEELECL